MRPVVTYNCDDLDSIFSAKAMFEASAVKFCKSVGESSLLPAPTIDRAARCQPLQVVVKKDRRWWSWQSPAYEPSPFSLSQLIKEKDEIHDKVSIKKRDLLSYNKIHQLSVSGKLGSEIKSLLDVELDGSDSVDVEAKFGDITKNEVDQTQLMAYVATRHLNLDHPYIKQVRENDRKSLTVVVGNCYLKSGGSVTAKKTIKATEKLDETVTESIATVNEEIDVNNEDDKTMKLPAGTIIAYSVCELLVGADGKMTLCIAKNKKGGFEEKDEKKKPVDSPDGFVCSAGKEEPEVVMMFKPILETDNTDVKQKLRESVLHMCRFPADIDTCLVLLKECSKLDCAGDSVTKTTDVTSLEKKFLCQRAVWSYILQAVGFQFQEGGAVMYPRDNSLLPAVQYMFEALIEVNDSALIKLSDLTQEYAKSLIYLLTQTIEEKAVQISDSELSPLYAGSNPGQDFVEAMEFNINAAGELLPPSGSLHELHGASRALYGLFWEKEFDSEISNWNCSIL